MGIKKRTSSSLEGVGGAVDQHIDSGVIGNNVSSESVKKRLKKENKRKKKERENDFDIPSTSHGNSAIASVKPMEKLKKRRALDKMRHHTGAKDDDNENQMALEPKENVSKSNEEVSPSGANENSVLPEFHIGVFKDLASAEASVREAAAEALVKELLAVQKAYDKLKNKDEVEGALKLEADKDDGLNNCAPSLRYAVRRLIRGVSSSRECARQGFALGLSVLVGAVPTIKVDSLLKLIVNLLEVSSSMKGQEARDCLLGRLFAYGALARSGRITEDLNLDQNSSYIKDLTSSLISIGSKKRYLQEPAVAVILELVEKLPIKALVDDLLEAPGLEEWFDAAIQTGNPDALFLALKIREKLGFNHGVLGKILPSEYSPNKLFSVGSLSLLANCLKESTFCQPRVHSVWPVLVNILLPDMVSQDVDLVSATNSTKKHKKGRKCSLAEEDTGKNLQCFLDVIIEGSLLTSSHDRKHLAFDILLQLFPKLPTSCVQVVLSYKFIQCLIDILSTKDSWLYKVAQNFLRELTEWVKNDDAKRVAIIMALQKHSNGKFDSLTKTKTVKELMAEFKSESDCLLLVQELMNMFLDEIHASEEPSDQSQTTDDNSEIGSIEDKDSAGITGSSEFLKSWVIDSLPSVLKQSKLDSEARFRVQKEILKFLAVQGLFCSSLGTEVTSFDLQEKFRWPKSAISSGLSRMCIEQLELLLANAQKGEGPHPITSGLDSNDLGSYFMRFLGTLCNIPSVSLFRALNEDDEKAFKKLQAMETQLSREERNCGLSKDANKLHALRYMLIQLLLQILLRPGEFHEASAELIICCKRSFGTSDLVDSSGEDELSEDGAPDTMDVLVDTMLSLLPQSSAPLRSAIEQVFKFFSGDITEDGITRMLRVIKKDLKPARHQDSGSEDDDDEDDDLLDIEEAEESETGDTDEQTDDSEAVSGVEPGSTELPETSDSDGGMDDEAMFRMDTYLAQIFKERKNQAGSETAQSQLVLFKLRVLSLLEIYLHENPGKQQVLKVFSNLVQAFVNPHTTEGSEQLGQRIWGILQKKIFKAKEYPRGEAVQLSVLESLLEKNLKLASKPFKKKKSAPNSSSKKQSASWNRHKMITSLAKNSTFWILKVMDARSFSVSELQKVFDILKGMLNSYFDSKKSQMKSEFLKEIFRRRPWIGHNLLGFLLEKCGSAKSQFRQVEALDLISEVLRSLAINADDGGQDTSTNILKSHLPQLYHLVKGLLTFMPEKQSRRADVRKFCGKVFQILKNQNLTSLFLKALEPDVRAACETHLGDTFLAFEKR